MEDEVIEILAQLKSLEDFFTNDYISLKTYYEIKENILLKYIAIGESYRSENKEKIENVTRADY